MVGSTSPVRPDGLQRLTLRKGANPSGKEAAEMKADVSTAAAMRCPQISHSCAYEACEDKPDPIRAETNSRVPRRLAPAWR